MGRRGHVGLMNGIVHLIQWMAERRGVPPDSGWDWFVREPAHAPLLPLIHYFVPDTVLPLSETSRERCARAYYHTLARNLLIYGELSRVLAALATADHRPQTAAKISAVSGRPSVVVLKGAVLALTLYPSIGLRPMGDVDLLVPQARLAEAVRCLKALGYVEPTPDMAPGLNRIVGHHVSLVSSRDIPLHVEVHWTLVGGEHNRYAPSMAWFWEQTEPLTPTPHPPSPSPNVGRGGGGCRGEGVRASLTLCPTAHLLYLAAHLMLQHGGARAGLLWFCDIDFMVRREADRLDWDDLLRRCREFRWAAALHAALQGVQERFGTPLPREFLDVLGQVGDHQAARLVERKAGPLQTRAVGVWNVLSALDGRARLRLALGIAFPSPAYMRWPCGIRIIRRGWFYHVLFHRAGAISHGQGGYGPSATSTGGGISCTRG